MGPSAAMSQATGEPLKRIMEEESIQGLMETVLLHRLDGAWVVTPGTTQPSRTTPAAPYFQHHMKTPISQRIFFETQADIDAFLAEDMTGLELSYYGPLIALQAYISDVRAPRHQGLVLTFNEVIAQLACSKKFDPRGADGAISFDSLISAKFEDRRTFEREPFFIGHDLIDINHLGFYQDDSSLWGGAYRYKLNQGLERLSNIEDLIDSQAMIAAGARIVVAAWPRHGRVVRLDAHEETDVVAIAKVRRNSKAPMFLTSRRSGWYRNHEKFKSKFHGKLWVLNVQQPEIPETHHPAHGQRTPVPRTLPLDVLSAAGSSI